jgi:2,4-dienoyl-CoA reductase (NADPH2)
MTTSFPKLFSPLTVGRRQMRNRIAHAPMSVCYADEMGLPTRAMVEHYGRRAKGGVGMVITENVAISRAGRQMPKQPMLADASAVGAFAEIAAEIKRHGALAVMQIVHAGRYAGPWSEYEAARRLAPSSVEFSLLPDRKVTPAEITEAEIEESLAAFVAAALRAQEAGFDGIEIHAAQGFLNSSFFSPGMNKRQDRWGGSLENRTRFLLEVARRIKAAVRPDFIIGCQLMSDELKPGGWQLDEAQRLIPLLEAAGVDFILPVVSTFETLKSPDNAGLFAKPKFQHVQAAAIKSVATVPVFANGGIRTPEVVEEVLQADADAVALARPLFTDPDWVAKVAAGTADVMTCDCTSNTCLRTQLTGSQCECWPEAVQKRGFYGYAA